MLNYYQILGVSTTANKDEIKTAFKKLAFTLHPDKNPGNALAEEQFKQINEAYQVLSNEEKRALYNLKLYYATQPPLPRYPEYEPTSSAGESRSGREYQRRTYAYARPRYASRVEFEPGYLRRMYLLLAGCFALFVVGAVYFSHFMDRWNAEQCYQEAVEEGESYAAMLKFSEAIAFDKKFWQAYYQRGKLRMEILGDYRHAYYDFNSVIRYADTLTGSMYYNRGICSYQLSQYADALTDFGQALQFDPGNGKAYYLRSLTYLSLQDTARACLDWQQASRLGVTFPEDSLRIHCK